MKTPVMRALDRSNVFFGIKGSYIMYAGVVIGVCVLVGLAVGSLTGSGLIAFVLGLGAGAAGYLAVTSFQSRHSEKERDQMIASLKLSDVIRVRPVSVYQMLSSLPSGREELTSEE